MVTARCHHLAGSRACSVRAVRRRDRPHPGRVDAVVAHPGPPGRRTPPTWCVILLDDTGFSHFGCYGSDLATPNIDALAAGGLRYTNFHVTPLCSPTRAVAAHRPQPPRRRDALHLQLRHRLPPHARPHHQPRRHRGRGAPRRGLRHLRRRQVAPVQHGERVGRRALRPVALPAGLRPLLRVPRGRDRPVLPRAGLRQPPRRAAGHPRRGLPPERGPGRPRHRLHPRHRSRSAPTGPFFTYLAFGAMHAPHQAPAAYLEKYRGRFDDGWDVARDQWFARQMEMGLLPPDTQLAPRNPGVEPWDTLPENQRRLAARLQEAFAAFLEHTDAQIGRLVDALERLGQLDNTAVHPAVGQRGQPGGRALRRHARDEVLQLPGRDARRGGRADRRHRRPPQPLELPVGLGPGRQHPVQVVQAEHPRRRRPRPAHRALAGPASPTGARCATSSTT